MKGWTRTTMKLRLIWLSAVTSWLLLECIVIWMQYAKHQHNWWSVSFLYSPIMSLVPIIAGVNLRARIDAKFKGKDDQLQLEEISSALAIMVISSYLTLIACVLGFL